MANQPITPEVIAQYVNKQILEFANAYFGHIPDPNQRITTATNAVRAAGYGVNRGVIFAPYVKKPDIVLDTTTTGVQYLRMKGKMSPNPKARTGLTSSWFPSMYAQEFNVSLMSYGGKQPFKGIKVNVPRDKVAFNADGSVSITLTIYPDKTMLLAAQGFIKNAVLGQNQGQGYTQGQTQTTPAKADCFGFYNPNESECKQCADAVACSQVPPQ